MKKRAYHSESRKVQAADTRLRILKAAKELFADYGFDQVTIQMLAEASMVSMPTIYALFKSKRGVLASMIDEAMPDKQFTELVEASMKEPSPVLRLGITATLSRKLYDAERGLMDILRGASVVAPEFKELEVERENRRYSRQGEYVKKLQQDGFLAAGLTLEKARDILWALTGRDIYRMFVIDRKWSSDEYEVWLRDELIRALLQPNIADRG